MTELGARLGRSLSAPVDIAWLAGLRVLLGATMFVSMARFIGYGWIDSFFVTPSFHFKYFGFDWLSTLPRWAMHGLFWALFALSLAITLGLFFRAACLLFSLGFGYLQLVDVTTYLNHYYLASLLILLLSFSPADRWGSLRVRLRPAERAEFVPAIWLWTLRFQVGVVYTFAGLAKAHGDWLWYAQPLRIWLSARTDMPVLGPLFTLEGMPLVMSWAGFLFDTFIVWLLLVPRLRLVAYALVLAFHALTRALFPIGMFPFIMVSAALVFFSPSWPRRALVVLERMVSRRPQSQASAFTLPSARPTFVLPRWSTALVGLYALFQLALPMRHLAYGGNVHWHEQGMRFSWRVMVREKNGSVSFVVRQKSSGRTWYLSPHQYLTRLQEKEMASQPDLILQLAHHIARDFARRGFGEVEVRADALASLNGRRMRRLIDPNVNLAQVRDGFAPASWVLPAPQEPPPRVRPI